MWAVIFARDSSHTHLSAHGYLAQESLVQQRTEVGWKDCENQPLRKWRQWQIPPKTFILLSCLCLLSSLTSRKDWLVPMLCWFLLLASPPPPYPLLPHHSACLSHSPFSRKAETFLQLPGFFPWRISLIAPPDWVSLAGWWHWLYSISTLLPSWENVPFTLPLYPLFLLQLFYIFSGVKKKSKPKDQNFPLPPVTGLYDFTLCKAFLLFASQEISGSSQWGLWGHTHAPPWPSPVSSKTKVRISIPVRVRGKSPGVGNGNPLQYSCLENSRDRGAWQATVHRVPKSQTWLSKQAHV